MQRCACLAPKELSAPRPFFAVTFKSDHTYTATGGCRQDGPGPHCFAIGSFSGTWAGHTSGPQLGSPAGAQQIVLTDSLKQKNPYFYSLADGTMSLSGTYRGKASVFHKHVDGATGSYTATGADSLPFYAISIAKDGTFSATGGCRPATAAGIATCHSVSHASGSWSTAATSGAAQIVLVDAFDQTSKYFFTLSGKTLSLSKTLGGEASDFTAD